MRKKRKLFIGGVSYYAMRMQKKSAEGQKMANYYKERNMAYTAIEDTIASARPGKETISIPALMLAVTRKYLVGERLIYRHLELLASMPGCDFTLLKDEIVFNKSKDKDKEE